MRTRYVLPVLAVLAVIPVGVDSCAISPPVALFSTKKRPADVHGEFLRGKLGVLQYTYSKRDKIAAYRILSGRPLTAAEEADFYPQLKTPEQEQYPSNASAAWVVARGRLSGLTSPSLSLYKSRPVTYQHYRNCLEHAFDHARQTLEARAKQWGLASEKVKEWVTAQDTVFVNCNAREPAIPAAPTADMDAVLAADREYQIAAAYFYAEQWTQSREAFDRIARNGKSPWSRIAPYLAARVSLREGTLDDKPEALRDAVRRFTPLAADAKYEWRNAAANLLRFARLRIDPGPRLKELGEALATPRQHPPGAVEEFVYLLDRTANVPEESSDLGAWLMQHNATERWRATKSTPWLVASLMTFDGISKADLLDAARRIAPTSPAYESAVYYGIIHLVSAGQSDEARRWAEEALRQKLTVSGRNWILSERLKLARSYAEFLRFAPRRPEPNVAEYDNFEVDVEQVPAATGTAPLFDADAAGFLNRGIPLRRWLEASNSPLLSPHLQLQIAQSGWFRAVLLERHDFGRQFMQRIVALQPQAARVAGEYLAAKDPEAARFTAVFLMLRAPFLTPFVPPGAVSLSDLTRLAGRTVHSEWGFSDYCWPRPPTNAPEPAFLSATEREEADQEWEQLENDAPAGADYLARAVLKWARTHADDPRVPQALHLAVRGTRLGCKSKETGGYSREAFELLHKRYAKSEWAAQTRYWYK